MVLYQRQTVRRDELFGLSGRLLRLAGELEGQAGELRRRAEEASWEGVAARAFRRRMRRRVTEALGGASRLRLAAAALEEYARGLAPAGAIGGSLH